MEKQDTSRIPGPPPLEEFELIVTNAALVESLRKIRQDTLVNSVRDQAWIPHLHLVEEFMRKRGIRF
jgi:hypothetical protein